MFAPLFGLNACSGDRNALFPNTSKWNLLAWYVRALRASAAPISTLAVDTGISRSAPPPPVVSSRSANIRSADPEP